MGKKKKTENYERANLQELAEYMENVRVPMEGGNIPRFHINLNGLEETIKSLPQEPRERIEKFWGLKPGTINHTHSRSTLGNNAYQIMFKNFTEAVKIIFRVEYSSKYDLDVAELVKNLVSKVNKGKLNMSDIEVIKYLNILFVILYGGPNMLFEDENYVNAKADGNTSLDEYGILLETWKQVKDAIPDNSINLELLIHVIEMFDFEDAVAMKEFANIRVSKEDRKKLESIERVKTLSEIRRFKMKIFPYGAWWITLNLIVTPNDLDLTKFLERLNFLRQDWENIKFFKTRTKQIMTAEGEKTLQVYNIGGLEFTDSYEVMSLYVARNLIFQEK